MNDDKESNDETPLYLASFEQLADELRKRTESMLLVTLTKDKVESDGWWPEYWSKGGQFVAIGLCKWVERIILDDTTSVMRNEDDGDEPK